MSLPTETTPRTVRVSRRPWRLLPQRPPFGRTRTFGSWDKAEDAARMLAAQTGEEAMVEYVPTGKRWGIAPMFAPDGSVRDA